MPSASEFLTQTFEFEYCPECGGDHDDHDAALVLGNWVAFCRHPLPDDVDPAAELERRYARQDQGLALC